MRSRSIRLSFIIILLLAIAVAALGFKTINIDIPGVGSLDRDGTGPLGLKLGLDLRGGGHLVYQADTGTRFDVTFEEPVDLVALNAKLEEARFGDDQLALDDFQLVPRTPQRLQIKTSELAADDPRRTGLEEALVEEFGAISLFQVTDIEAPTADQMEGVLDNITRRVNRFGTEEPIIQIFGDDRIIVQLPGASGSTTEIGFVEPQTEPDTEAKLRSALEGAGFEDIKISRRDDSSFRVTSETVGASQQAAAALALIDQVGAVNTFTVTSGIDEAKDLIGQTARLVFKERTCQTSACVVFADTDLGLTGDNLSRAEAGADPVGIGWVINLQFDGPGTEIFSRLTNRIQGDQTKRIAVFMDDVELLAPVARAHIRDGRTQISGNFTRDEARTLSIQLESGRLAVPLKLIQESDVDALLGSESLRNSLIAGFIGLGLVVLFMVAYYRMAGVVAAGALVFYTVVVLAIFKLIPITLELAHIGGFILSIGMAVDANILIFERMKEEVRIGRTLASSMEVGFSRAWPAIRDSNVSTMITCLVLLWFGDRLGGGLVTGVAISLFIGVAVSMFTAVVVSRNLLQLMAFIGLGQHIELFTPEPVRRDAHGSVQTAGQSIASHRAGGSR